MNTTALDLTTDTIDVRDIIARVEDIETAIEEPNATRDDIAEYATLRTILNELKGYGGDEQWRGDWYPITLIRDSYFVRYASQLCMDIGDIPENLLSYIEIDWDATARNIRVDYTPVEIDGSTYWYR